MIMYTHVFDVFDGNTGFTGQFGFNMIVFIGFGNFFVKDGSFAGLVTDGPFIHLKTVILKFL